MTGWRANDNSSDMLKGVGQGHFQVESVKDIVPVYATCSRGQVKSLVVKGMSNR
jgi:hypothetical protein